MIYVIDAAASATATEQLLSGARVPEGVASDASARGVMSALLTMINTRCYGIVASVKILMDDDERAEQRAARVATVDHQAARVRDAVMSRMVIRAAHDARSIENMRRSALARRRYENARVTGARRR